MSLYFASLALLLQLFSGGIVRTYSVPSAGGVVAGSGSSAANAR